MMYSDIRSYLAHACNLDHTCIKCNTILTDDDTENLCNECESIIYIKIKSLYNIVDYFSANVICKKLNICLISDKNILKMYILDCGISVFEIIREFSLDEIKNTFGFSDIEMFVVEKEYF